MLRDIFDIFSALGAFGSFLTAYLGFYAVTLFLRHRKRELEWRTIEFLSKDAFHKASGKGLSALTDAAMREFKEQGNSEHVNVLELSTYLSELDLAAISIRKNLIDEDIAFDYLGATIIFGFNDAADFIEFVRYQYDQPRAYSDLEALARVWQKRWDAHG